MTSCSTPQALTQDSLVREASIARFAVALQPSVDAVGFGNLEDATIDVAAIDTMQSMRRCLTERLKAPIDLTAARSLTPAMLPRYRYCGFYARRYTEQEL